MRDKYQKKKTTKKQKLKEPLYNCYLTPTEDKNKKKLSLGEKVTPQKYIFQVWLMVGGPSTTKFFKSPLPQ